MRRVLALSLSYFLLFGTLAFLILTLFLLFLSSLCRHNEGKKKKGKQSCWQRSASPARGPRCLGLVHHGRQSHLQIRRETLKECKWERKRGREKTERMREKKRGTGITDNACGNTHTVSTTLPLTHTCVWIWSQKNFTFLFLSQTKPPPNPSQYTTIQFFTKLPTTLARSQDLSTLRPKYYDSYVSADQQLSLNVDMLLVIVNPIQRVEF